MPGPAVPRVSPAASQGAASNLVAPQGETTGVAATYNKGVCDDRAFGDPRKLTKFCFGSIPGHVRAPRRTQRIDSHRSRRSTPGERERERVWFSVVRRTSVPPAWCFATKPNTARQGSQARIGRRRLAGRRGPSDASLHGVAAARQGGHPSGVGGFDAALVFCALVGAGQSFGAALFDSSGDGARDWRQPVSDLAWPCRWCSALGTSRARAWWASSKVTTL